MMLELFALVLLSAIVSAGVAAWIKRRRPSWSLARTAIVAAAPWPAILTAISLWVVLSEAYSPTEAECCLVDPKGFALTLAMGGIGYAIISFLVGAVSAGLVKRVGQL